MNRWIHFSRDVGALLWLGLATQLPLLAGTTNGPVAPSQKWAAEIGRLTAGDATNPPAAGGIVFVGSSSIRMWTGLEQAFPGLPVVRRGFGGSELADSVYFADRIIFPYRPRVVVVYAGDNDIAHGKIPATVAADFDAFRAVIHRQLPRTRIVYISIKPSPVRAAFHEQFKEANASIARTCAKDPLCTFVDVWPLMLDETGQPREDLFVDDRLHMNAAGYDIWRKAILPCLVTTENERAPDASGQ